MKIPKHKNPCFDCGALCCKGVAVPISTPRSKSDWDEIRWLVAHERVQVFKDHENDWLVEFMTPCEKLDEKDACKVYSIRPKICRDHEHDECVKNGEEAYHKIIFRHLEDVDAYLAKRELKKLKRKK
ncbi:MAG: hypothetical protein HOE11_00720 [Candidatus Diapherotrites archaeon]|nr:hypothetical protein [Candidatus Diapherotrites archaeon]MBT4596401.1 hypothetical protein [Candidatus Diapherotrites archaeon]